MALKYSQLMLQRCRDVVHKIVPMVTMNFEAEVQYLCKVGLHRLKDDIDRTSAGKRYAVRGCMRACLRLCI